MAGLTLAAPMWSLDGPMTPYRVLVVDDHPDTAEVLTVLFSLLGHETRCALRGRDALHITRELDPDLVLLDICLPDITGFEVVRALRADTRRPDRYIAAVTGKAGPTEASRAARMGFDQHLVKPVDIGQLRQVLRCAESHYAQAIAATRN
jgi:CheY-like chemotaxis protein